MKDVPCERIDQLYHAALERARDEARSLRRRGPRWDKEMRLEDESLLAIAEPALHFIDDPLDTVAAENSLNRRLKSYELSKAL